MPSKRGAIALMGSGELTSTMVQVHKDLLRSLEAPSHALFLDTPAGFQPNPDELAERALKYFHQRIAHPMSVASFNSKQISFQEAERVMAQLRSVDNSTRFLDIIQLGQ